MELHSLPRRKVPRLVARVYDLLKQPEPQRLVKAWGKPEPKGSKKTVYTTPKAPGHSGAPVLHPGTGEPVTHEKLSAAVSKFMSAQAAAKAPQGAQGAKPGAQPSKPAPAVGGPVSGGPQGDRKDVQHPGSRGGKWYRTKAGEIRYGTPPAGTPHEKIDEPQGSDFKSGQEIAWQGKGGVEHGEVTGVGATGLMVQVPGGTQSWHIPFSAVRQTKNPEPQGAKQNVTPEQLSRGATVHWEDKGGVQHGKVKSWGAQGARVVTHDGEFDVPYGDLRGLGIHPDTAAEQPEVVARAAAGAAGPMGAQEDAPIKPTAYALDDLQVGMVVGVSAPGSSSEGSKPTKYRGTLTKIGEKSGLLEVTLEKPTPGGSDKILVFPHEITDAAPPKAVKPVDKGVAPATERTESQSKAPAKATDAGAAVNAQKGDMLHVVVGDHDYGDVMVKDPAPGQGWDGFVGEYTGPTGAKTEGHFHWDEVKGPGKAMMAANIEAAKKADAPKTQAPKTAAPAETSGPKGPDIQADKDPEFERQHDRDAHGRFLKMAEHLEAGGWKQEKAGDGSEWTHGDLHVTLDKKDGSWTLKGPGIITGHGSHLEGLAAYSWDAKKKQANAAHAAMVKDAKPGGSGDQGSAKNSKPLDPGAVEKGHAVKFLSAQGVAREGKVADIQTNKKGETVLHVKTGVSGWVYKVPVSSVTYHQGTAVNGGPHGVFESLKGKKGVKADGMSVEPEAPAGLSADQTDHHPGLVKQGWSLMDAKDHSPATYQHPDLPGETLEIHKDGTWDHYDASGKAQEYGAAVTSTDVHGLARKAKAKPQSMAAADYDKVHGSGAAAKKLSEVNAHLVDSSKLKVGDYVEGYGGKSKGTIEEIGKDHVVINAGSLGSDTMHEHIDFADLNEHKAGDEDQKHQQHIKHVQKTQAIVAAAGFKYTETHDDHGTDMDVYKHPDGSTLVVNADPESGVGGPKWAHWQGAPGKSGIISSLSDTGTSLRDYVNDPKFESEHPRGPGGQFASKGWSEVPQTGEGALYKNKDGEYLKVAGNGKWAHWKPGAFTETNGLHQFKGGSYGGTDEDPMIAHGGPPATKGAAGGSGPSHKVMTALEYADAQKKPGIGEKPLAPKVPGLEKWAMRHGDVFESKKTGLVYRIIGHDDNNVKTEILGKKPGFKGGGMSPGDKTSFALGDITEKFTGKHMVPSFEGAVEKQAKVAPGYTPEAAKYEAETAAPAGWTLKTATGGTGGNVKVYEGVGGDIVHIQPTGHWTLFNDQGDALQHGVDGLAEFKQYYEAKESKAPSKADDLMDQAAGKPEPKQALPPGQKKEEMVGPGLKKITVTPEAKFDPAKLSKPLDFMNWGGSGKMGPSSVKEKNEANQNAVNAIHKAAQTGSVEAIKALTAPTVLGKEGKVEGEGPVAKVLEHPSQHVKGYAQQLINELNEQQHPTEHVYYELEGEHPLAAISKGIKPLTTAAARTAHVNAGKTIAKYLDLGKVPPLSKEMFGAMFPAKTVAQVSSETESLFKKLSQQAAPNIPEHMKAAIQSLKNSSKNSGAWSGNQPEAIRKASEAIHKYGFFLPPHIQIDRHLHLSGQELMQLQGSEGHVLQEMGWSHTGSWSGNVHLRMRAAPGVKALFVGSGSGISSSHAGEHETGLPADTRLWVQKVSKEGGSTVVDAIILPHDADSYKAGAGAQNVPPQGYTAPTPGSTAGPAPYQAPAPTPSYYTKPKTSIVSVKQKHPWGSHIKFAKSGNVYKVKGYANNKVTLEYVKGSSVQMQPGATKVYTYAQMKKLVLGNSIEKHKP